MFNLIMRSQEWMPGPGSSYVGRMFEYTEDQIVSWYQKDSVTDLTALAALPCLFMVEGISDEVARVGHLTNARVVGAEVRFEVAFDAAVPPLRNSIIYENRIDFEMPREFEFSRNHWAVKNVDLYRVLYRLHRNQRQRPSVFRLTEHEAIDHGLVSVMMPFALEYSAVFECLKKVAAASSLECLRADDIWEEHNVIQDVVNLIDRARIVICDCTGRNANVFYEAGIAHTLGREVILISQNDADIPFDLRHLRYVRYSKDDEGLEKLAEALATRIGVILGK